MIKINLLAERKAGKKTVAPTAVATAAGGGNFLLPIFAIIIILVIAILGLWIWMTKKSLSTLENKVADMVIQAKKYENIHEQVKELEEKNKEYKDKVEQIKILKAQQSGPVTLMGRLLDIVPDAVWLISLKEKDGTIMTEGMAKNIKAISTFYDNLKDSKDFTAVNLGDTVQVSTTGVYSFSMSFKYIPPGMPVSEGEANGPQNKTGTQPQPGKKSV